MALRGGGVRFFDMRAWKFVRKWEVYVTILAFREVAKATLIIQVIEESVPFVQLTYLLKSLKLTFGILTQLIINIVLCTHSQSPSSKVYHTPHCFSMEDTL